MNRKFEHRVSRPDKILEISGNGGLHVTLPLRTYGSERGVRDATGTFIPVRKVLRVIRELPDALKHVRTADELLTAIAAAVRTLPPELLHVLFRGKKHEIPVSNIDLAKLGGVYVHRRWIASLVRQAEQRGATDLDSAVRHEIVFASRERFRGWLKRRTFVSRTPDEVFRCPGDPAWVSDGVVFVRKGTHTRTYWWQNQDTTLTTGEAQLSAWSRETEPNLHLVGWKPSPISAQHRDVLVFSASGTAQLAYLDPDKTRARSIRYGKHVVIVSEDILIRTCRSPEHVEFFNLRDMR